MAIGLVNDGNLPFPANVLPEIPEDSVEQFDDSNVPSEVSIRHRIHTFRVEPVVSDTFLKHARVLDTSDVHLAIGIPQHLDDALRVVRARASSMPDAQMALTYPPGLNIMQYDQLTRAAYWVHDEAHCTMAQQVLAVYACLGWHGEWCKISSKK